MIEDAFKRGSGQRPVDARAHPGTTEARLRPGTLLHDLEELRDCVLQKLDSIEGLARRRAGAASAEITRLEQTLKQRIEELEIERGRLRSGVDQEQSNWKQLLGQLESDRQLLAEAWERLERERIEVVGAGIASGSHRARPAEGSVPHVSPTPPPSVAPRAPAGAESGNPVAETILRQFQALCSDVRRTADTRCSSR
jgi:hypothetical protein